MNKSIIVNMREFEEMKDSIAYWKRGHGVIEKAMNKAYAGDWQDAPMPLTGEEASLWLRAQGEAYQHALEMMGVPSTFTKEG